MAGQKRILVAEDEKPMAKALQLKLQKKGYEVDVVSNGKEALDALQKEKYSILLLDLMMPEVDGFTVLEEMKKKDIKVPVIASTNLSQSQDEDKVRALGARDFFVKSDTPLSEVIDYIEKILK